MYKITNLKSGFFQYRNAKNLATFLKYNSSKKYNIEEIESIDIKNIFYAVLACAMMLLFIFGFIYFATNGYSISN